MLHFDRKLDIFGDVLTHGYNWAKMRNKRKRPHVKDGTERAQAGRPGALGPAGLAHFGAQSVSVFFSTKYATTLIYVLPKPPTISAYKYPEAAVKEGASKDRRRAAEKIERIQRRASRDTFKLDTRERRHQRPHHPSVPLQVGGQQGIHPLPEISSP